MIIYTTIHDIRRQMRTFISKIWKMVKKELLLSTLKMKKPEISFYQVQV